MIRKFDIDPANSDPNGIAEDQQPDDGTPFVLNGAQSDLGTAGQWDIGDSYSSGIAGAQLNFESGGNWSGVTFTITGLDESGLAQTETHTGPNATTNTTTKFWSRVTSITASGTVATDIEVGAADVLTTPVIQINRYATQEYATAILGLSGTIQGDIDITYDDIQGLFDDGTYTDSSDINWLTHLSNQSADVDSAIPVGTNAVRFKVDSYTDTAELQFHVNGV